MLWSLADVADATGGRLLGGPQPGGRFMTGVGIDSRRLARGALFVPLRAGRDGHDFLAAAVAAGAGGYLIEAGHPALRRRPISVAAVEVGDTAAALTSLGRAARERLRGPVVGITGSVGKTSTKDLVAAALAAGLRTASNERSFNNELGVPLTLANAPDGTEVAVVEMGARGAGHITQLCKVAKPTMAVVTSVAAVHTSVFDGLDSVASAKAELVEKLPPSGTAVLNYDDARVAAMADRTAAEVLRYSALSAAGADVTASRVVLDDQLRPRFELRSPWGAVTVRLGVHGAHQVGNALAAVAVALRCGVPLEAAVSALAGATLSPWRMEMCRAPSGATVINDAYNASPASMAAALDALMALDAARRVAVVGEMAELGDGSAEAHLRVAALAGALGIEVIAVGTDAYGLPALSIEEAIDALGVLGPRDAVLVKASRAVGLERLAERLAGPPGCPGW